MPDREALDLSRRLNRRYRELHARLGEAERTRVGSARWSKLDTILQRELVLEQREAILAAMSPEPADESRTFRVVANMRSGAARAGFVRSGTSAQKKRRAVAALKRQGNLALKRLTPDLERDGVRTLQALWLTHSVAIEADRAGLLEVAGRDDIRSVNHDKRTIAVCLDASRPLIGADQVETVLGFDGAGVNVAVCDTGVDFAHAALAPVMGAQLDFTGEGTGDLNGHGTHCAGIVASNDAARRGTAPGCRLSDYKLMDGSGSANASECVTAIQQTVADGIDVTSHSWGFSHRDGAWVCKAGECVLCTAADAAVNAGQIFVVAAGNEDNDSCGTFDTHLRCPGHADLPITVAASDDSDAMADFSSIGPTVDGRAKPDITAPGVDIASARASTTNDWIEISGTSQATPHVAGVCALMLERNPAVTPQVLKAVIMQTAVNIGATPDEMGAGRVDALAAVNAV